MITLRNPELLRELATIPCGLFPVENPTGKGYTLLIKCPKEVILTAKLCRQIKFYLVPLNADGVETHGLVTAFFDDSDEPLVIRSPLLDDDMSKGIFALLSSQEFNIHFFDEHNRELLGYCAKNLSVDEFRSRLDTLHLAPPTYIPSTRIDDQLSIWFSNRTSENDNNALVVKFLDTLFPDDFVIWDTRPEDNSYHGRKTDMFTSLERNTPGIFSELDIIKCLHRVFESDQIYLNPVRTDDGKEFVDVLVATPSNLLLIQAKDSPNTEEILGRPIKRKISTVAHHLKKATSQMRGSISYATAGDSMSVDCGSVRHTFDTDNLDIVGLIIVRELFTTEHKHYSQLAFNLFENTRVPCFIQDYPEFHNFTYHRRTEKNFFDTLKCVLRFANLHDQFPRSRFWA